MIELTSSQVHIWHYRWDGQLPGDVLARMQMILSADERGRAQQFRFEKDRQAYVVAHALVRRVLAQYRDEDERAWKFADGEYGKPFIVAPSSGAELSFSLTHTGGLVACAVSPHMEIGVDAENVSRRCGMMEIARGSFALAELKHLESTPLPSRRELFFKYWTLKEAYVKARGLGLSLALQDFSLELRDTHALRISFRKGLDRDPLDWHFRLYRPTAQYILAAAVRTPGPAQFTLRDAAEELKLIH